MAKCFNCAQDAEVKRELTVGDEKLTETFCGDDCYNAALGFIRYFERTKRYFFIGLALALCLVFGGVFTLSAKAYGVGAILMGAGLVALGATVVAFPFATPQSFQLLGIRKTLRITRIVGVVVMALGPLMTVFLMNP